MFCTLQSTQQMHQIFPRLEDISKMWVHWMHNGCSDLFQYVCKRQQIRSPAYCENWGSDGHHIESTVLTILLLPLRVDNLINRTKPGWLEKFCPVLYKKTNHRVPVNLALFRAIQPGRSQHLQFLLRYATSLTCFRCSCSAPSFWGSTAQPSFNKKILTDSCESMRGPKGLSALHNAVVSQVFSYKEQALA